MLMIQIIQQLLEHEHPYLWILLTDNPSSIAAQKWGCPIWSSKKSKYWNASQVQVLALLLLLRFLAQLAVIQFAVKAALLQQHIMRALFQQLPIFQYQNPVCLTNRV